MCNGCGGKYHFEAKCMQKSKKGKSQFTCKSRKCDKCGHFGKNADSVECDHDSNNDGIEDTSTTYIKTSKLTSINQIVNGNSKSKINVY